MSKNTSAADPAGTGVMPEPKVVPETGVAPEPKVVPEAEVAPETGMTPEPGVTPEPATPEFVLPSKAKLVLIVLVATVRRFALPIVAAVAVAALVAVVILAWQLQQQRDVDSASAAALDAARAYGTTLTSVDSNNLDQGFAAVLDGSTGEFKDMYSRSSGQLRQLLVDNKATGQGTVLDAAVKSATDTEVEVLLFIDQTVTNAAAQDPRVDRSRVAMTMQLVDGRRLASRVYLP
ncbi:DUF3329 domain-containing protein [Nocardia jiangsuensis]|uniref:DUF3329 domain-containing protein n=1 Tax=Nocardia jiangsuensis TaxID=1691563 RepID=A0ABV8DXM7_9NOCA